MSFKSKFSAVLLAGSVSLTAIAGAAFAAPLTYPDMIKMDRINGFKVDPTGRYAVLSIRVTDMEKNKGVTSLWLKDLTKPETPEVKLAVSEGGAGNAQFGPDGTIYFISGRGEGGTDQVWKTDITGATATQVTKLPLDVQAYQITPDGKGIVVGLAVFPDCGKAEVDCTVKRQADRTLDKSSGMVYDKIFVRHWDTWADGTRNHLFYVPMAGGAPVALTPGYDGDVPSKPYGDEADYTISPDSKTVFFSAREAGKSEPWSTNFDIYSVPVDGSVAPANHTAANTAWDGSPRVSPDGKTVAYVAMKRPGFEADRFGIVLMDEYGKTRELAADWDRSVAGMQWAKDGKSLLVDADDVGKHTLFRVDVKTGKVTPLTKSGHTSQYAETPRGMVFLKDDLTHPSAFYQAKPKAAFIDDGATNLTKFNAAAAQLTTGAYEQFTFKGWNNEDVHGYVIKPAGYEEGKTYPVAFLIHGGPQGSFGDGWSYRWNPETYSGAGYAVVMIDFHGSTGYGQAFTDAISQHWGDRPLEDLQKGWAYAVDKYKFLNADKACALGASYGGFMVNWIAGNWKQPWKCLVSHDGVFDSRNMGYSTEEIWFEEWEQGAVVYDNPAKYDEFNPALHAKDWSKPMLIVHSDKDYRIPVEQGIGAFTALQRQGVESQFLRFPDENHWVLKPANSLKWHDTVFNFLDTHIGAKSDGAK